MKNISIITRLASIVTAFALVLSSISTVYADEQPDCGAAMYIPVSTDRLKGIASGWENSEVPAADMHADVKDTFSNAGWYDISTSGGCYWKAAWDTAANHKYNTADGTVTAQYPKGQPQTPAAWEALMLGNAVSAAEVKYVIIGVNSNVDTTRVRMYACKSDWTDNNATRSAGLNIKKGSNEIVCRVSAAAQPWRADNVIYSWDAETQIDRLKFQADANLAEDIELEFMYVRLVTDDYNGHFWDAYKTGTRVKRNTADFCEQQQVVDFQFLHKLDLSTVNTANVRINNQSVEWVKTSEESPSLFRVNLGRLRKNTKYTVSFNGVKTDGGADVKDEFTFSTEYVEPVYVTPSLHSLSRVRKNVGGWNSAESPAADMSDYVKDSFNNAGWFPIKTSGGSEWKYNWYTSIAHRYNTNSGTVSLRISPSYKEGVNDANPDTTLTFKTPVTAAEAKYLTIGVNSDADETMSAYLTQQEDGNTLSKQACVTVNVQKGFHEYVVPLNLQDFERVNSIRFSHAPRGFEPFTLEFSYVRLETEDYPEIGAGAEIAYTPFMEYPADAPAVDFVFPFELDFSTVTAENVTLNGRAADSILISPDNTKAFRAYFNSMQPITRCRLKLSGIRNTDSADIIADEYRFTVGAKEDLTAAPVMSWELVENYRTDSEAPVTGDACLNGKTLTAVAGGLYNNSGEEKEYMLVIASYKDGRLVNCGYEVKKIGAYQMIGEQSVTITIPEDGEVYNVKAFAIKVKDMSPLAGAVTPSGNVWYKIKQK